MRPLWFKIILEIREAILSTPWTDQQQVERLLIRFDLTPNSEQIARTVQEGMNPFKVFHISSKSIYRQKMGSKTLEHLSMFPRQF